MSKFFNTLINENLITDWAETLDWLFDDERFSEKRGWSKGYVGSFTKKVKTLNSYKDNYCYDAIKNLSFPPDNSKRQQVTISNGTTEGRDIIRHIRNGVAHGKTECFNSKGTLYLKILDYNNQGKQTAYICFPIHTIIDIYKKYEEVKKSKNNNKKKGRK